jgi:hypothetical protein
MLDLEYLSSENPASRQNVVHLVRTGVLSSRVQARLRAAAVAKGLMIERLVSIPDLAAPSMLGTRLDLIDIQELRTAGATDKEIEGIAVQLMRADLEHSSLIRIAHDDPALQTLEWGEVVGKALKLEEPLPAKQGFQKLVQTAAPHSTPIYDFASFTDWKALAQAATALFEEGAEPMLPDLMQRIESFVLAGLIDEETHAFDNMSVKRLFPHKTTPRGADLHAVVAATITASAPRSPGPLSDALARMVESHDGGVRFAMGSLHAAVRDLAAVNEALATVAPEGWPEAKVKRLKELGQIDPLRLMWAFACVMECEPEMIRNGPRSAIPALTARLDALCC